MSRNKSILKFIYFIVVFLIISTILMILNSYVSKYAENKALASIEETQDSGSTLPTIIIDAGHGGEDGGAIGVNGIYEKNINFEISMKVYELLKSSGFPVVLTRSSDILLYDTNIDYHGRKKALDLAKRLQIGQKYENSIFISIHQNTFSDPKYYGLQVYYSKNNDNSLLLAESIQNFVKKNLQTENERKVKPADKNIYLLYHLTSPAVLIECGFISNEKECDLLSTQEYQTKISTAIYLSILEYFEIS